MATELTFTEGMHYMKGHALDGATTYTYLVSGQTIAAGDITSSSTLVGLTELTASGYARKSCVTGADASGIQSIPGATWVSGVSWPSTVTGRGMASASSGGVCLYHWDIGGRTGNITSGSKIVTNLSQTSDLLVGQHVYGVGIAGGATISTIDSSSQVTLSANCTATTTGVSLGFNWDMSTTGATLIIPTVNWFYQNPNGI